MILFLADSYLEQTVEPSPSESGSSSPPCLRRRRRLPVPREVRPEVAPKVPLLVLRSSKDVLLELLEEVVKVELKVPGPGAEAAVEGAAEAIGAVAAVQGAVVLPTLVLVGQDLIGWN